MNKQTLEELGIDPLDVKAAVITNVSAAAYNDLKRDLMPKLIIKAEASIDAAINELTQEVLTQTFQPLTSWGEPQGEETTIRDMMAVKMENWWRQNVNKKGEASDRYGDKMTRAEWYARDIVGKYVDRQLRTEMKGIIDAGKDKVRQAMSKSIKEQIEQIW